MQVTAWVPSGLLVSGDGSKVLLWLLQLWFVRRYHEILGIHLPVQWTVALSKDGCPPVVGWIEALCPIGNQICQNPNTGAGKTTVMQMLSSQAMETFCTSLNFGIVLPPWTVTHRVKQLTMEFQVDERCPRCELCTKPPHTNGSDNVLWRNCGHVCHRLCLSLLQSQNDAGAWPSVLCPFCVPMVTTNNANAVDVVKSMIMDRSVETHLWNKMLTQGVVAVAGYDPPVANQTLLSKQLVAGIYLNILAPEKTKRRQDSSNDYAVEAKRLKSLADIREEVTQARKNAHAKGTPKFKPPPPPLPGHLRAQQQCDFKTRGSSEACSSGSRTQSSTCLAFAGLTPPPPKARPPIGGANHGPKAGLPQHKEGKAKSDGQGVVSTVKPVPPVPGTWYYSPVLSSIRWGIEGIIAMVQDHHQWTLELESAYNRVKMPTSATAAIRSLLELVEAKARIAEHTEPPEPWGRHFRDLAQWLRLLQTSGEPVLKEALNASPPPKSQLRSKVPSKTPPATPAKLPPVPETSQSLLPGNRDIHFGKSLLVKPPPGCPASQMPKTVSSDFLVADASEVARVPVTMEMSDRGIIELPPETVTEVLRSMNVDWSVVSAYDRVVPTVIFKFDPDCTVLIPEEVVKTTLFEWAMATAAAKGHTEFGDVLLPAFVRKIVVEPIQVTCEYLDATVLGLGRQGRTGKDWYWVGELSRLVTRTLRFVPRSLVGAIRCDGWISLSEVFQHLRPELDELYKTCVKANEAHQTHSGKHWDQKDEIHRNAPKICFGWQEGHCAFGNRCHFKHERKACFRFVWWNKCPDGLNCRNSHNARDCPDGANYWRSQAQILDKRPKQYGGINVNWVHWPITDHRPVRDLKEFVDAFLDVVASGTRIEACHLKTFGSDVFLGRVRQGHGVEGWDVISPALLEVVCTFTNTKNTKLGHATPIGQVQSILAFGLLAGKDQPGGRNQRACIHLRQALDTYLNKDARKDARIWVTLYDTIRGCDRVFCTSFMTFLSEERLPMTAIGAVSAADDTEMCYIRLRRTENQHLRRPHDHEISIEALNRKGCWKKPEPGRITGSFRCHQCARRGRSGIYWPYGTVKCILCYKHEARKTYFDWQTGAEIQYYDPRALEAVKAFELCANTIGSKNCALYTERATMEGSATDRTAELGRKVLNKVVDQVGQIILDNGKLVDPQKMLRMKMRIWTPSSQCHACISLFGRWKAKDAVASWANYLGSVEFHGYLRELQSELPHPGGRWMYFDARSRQERMALALGMFIEAQQWPEDLQVPREGQSIVVADAKGHQRFLNEQLAVKDMAPTLAHSDAVSPFIAIPCGRMSFRHTLVTVWSGDLVDVTEACLGYPGLEAPLLLLPCNSRVPLLDFLDGTQSLETEVAIRCSTFTRLQVWGIDQFYPLHEGVVTCYARIPIDRASSGMRYVALTAPYHCVDIGIFPSMELIEGESYEDATSRLFHGIQITLISACLLGHSSLIIPSELGPLSRRYPQVTRWTIKSTLQHPLLMGVFSHVVIAVPPTLCEIGQEYPRQLHDMPPDHASGLDYSDAIPWLEMFHTFVTSTEIPEFGFQDIQYGEWPITPPLLLNQFFWQSNDPSHIQVVDLWNCTRTVVPRTTLDDLPGCFQSTMAQYDQVLAFANHQGGTLARKALEQGLRELSARLNHRQQRMRSDAAAVTTQEHGSSKMAKLSAPPGLSGPAMSTASSSTEEIGGVVPVPMLEQTGKPGALISASVPRTRVKQDSEKEALIEQLRNLEVRRMIRHHDSVITSVNGIANVEPWVLAKAQRDLGHLWVGLHDVSVQDMPTDQDRLIVDQALRIHSLIVQENCEALLRDLLGNAPEEPVLEDVPEDVQTETSSIMSCASIARSCRGYDAAVAKGKQKVKQWIKETQQNLNAKWRIKKLEWAFNLLQTILDETNDPFLLVAQAKKIAISLVKKDYNPWIAAFDISDKYQEWMTQHTVEEGAASMFDEEFYTWDALSAQIDRDAISHRSAVSTLNDQIKEIAHAQLKDLILGLREQLQATKRYGVWFYRMTTALGQGLSSAEAAANATDEAVYPREIPSTLVPEYPIWEHSHMYAFGGVYYIPQWEGFH